MFSILDNNSSSAQAPALYRDDVIKWKQFSRYWPLWEESTGHPHKDQRRGALQFSLICAWINGWANNRDVGDLRRHRAHYDVTVIYTTRADIGHHYACMCSTTLCRAIDERNNGRKNRHVFSQVSLDNDHLYTGNTRSLIWQLCRHRWHR